MLHNKLWVCNPICEEKAKALSERAGISPLLSKVFISRGIEDTEHIKDFLNPSLDRLHSPFLLKDMDRAVDRIVEALESREKIVIYGDYDVDGTTSTSVLMNFLSALNADVTFYIPDRLEEGYGLSIAALDKIREMRPSLILTVDCGITAIEEVRYLRESGIDIVITDHHECKEELPQAYAVVNPHRPDCIYPFKELAGVGVVFKLVHALCIRLNLADRYLDYLDLVAVGTVADVVPLVDENRIIVRHGISQMEKRGNLGLKSLIQASGLKEKPITSWSIGFGIAPRINAAGRVGDARRAVRLFVTQDAGEAERIAAELNDENKFRQDTEAEIFRQAVEMVETQMNLERDKVIVIMGQSWHHGVIGIVASKITERYYRPCILFSHEDGICKGSGRSIEGFNLFKALTHCEGYLEKFGGHELAAGLALKVENLQLFKTAINEYADSVLTMEDLIPRIKVDVEVNREDISLEAVRQLERLAPFGAGNPSPVFAYKGLRLMDGRTVGADKHAKFRFEENGFYCEAIGFNMGSELEYYRGLGCMDVACALEINSWNSNEKLQLNVKDIKPCDAMIMENEFYSSLEKCFEWCGLDGTEEELDLQPDCGTLGHDELTDRIVEWEQALLKTAVLVNSLDSLRTLSDRMKKTFSTIKKTFKICYTNFNYSEIENTVIIVNPQMDAITTDAFDRIVFYGNWLSKTYLKKLLEVSDREKTYFCNGSIGSDFERETFVPDRGDLVPVYQYIRANAQGSLPVRDLNLLARKISDSYRVCLNAFKVKKSIEIFEELNLLKKESMGGSGILITVPDSIHGKVNLENSTLYRKLQALKPVKNLDTAL